MRSPTLLTGVTGAVAVLVFIYVGLMAMSLQPHITFGEPNLRVASADKAPANPGPASAVEPPAIPAAPSAPSAPVPAPAATAAAQGPASPLIAAGGLPVATAAAPPTASPPVAAPVTPAAIPQMPPSSAASVASPPAMAAMPPAASGVPSSAATASAPPAAALPAAAPAVTEISAAVADKPQAPTAAAALPPAVASAAPETPPASEASISERMAPPTPIPPTPRVASVPTPLARPTPTVAEDAEAPATVAEARQPDGTAEIAKPAVANTLPLDDKRAQVDRAAPPPLHNRAPPSESAALAPQPEKPAEDATSIEQPNGGLKSVDLSRPFAERAGILTIGGRSVQVAGIVPTDPERSCTGPNGKEWPCGTLARTALRSFLLGRTISCDVPDPAWKGTVTADCRFAKLSIGDWLVRNGWAEVASGSPFASVADEARKAGRGVYGNDPRKKHQSTLAPEPPKEDPLNPI